MADFCPRREDELIAWHAALAAVVEGYQSQVAITASKAGYDVGALSGIVSVVTTP